jgi:hypothetical protein
MVVSSATKFQGRMILFIILCVCGYKGEEQDFARYSTDACPQCTRRPSTSMGNRIWNTMADIHESIY